MIVVKEFTFDSAHQLKDYDGPCANLHGHTYKLQVSVSGEVQKNGIVIDFADLKKVVNEKILSKLDHKFLNEIIDQPSAENISLWIWEQLKEDFNLVDVKLWETPTSFVIYSGLESKKS